MSEKAKIKGGKHLQTSEKVGIGTRKISIPTHKPDKGDSVISVV